MNSALSKNWPSFEFVRNTIADIKSEKVAEIINSDISKVEIQEKKLIQKFLAFSKANTHKIMSAPADIFTIKEDHPKKILAKSPIKILAEKIENKLEYE